MNDGDWKLIVHDTFRLYRTHRIGRPTILKRCTIENHKSIGVGHPIFFFRSADSPYKAGWLSLRGYGDAFELMNWVCDYRLSMELEAAREICVPVTIDFRLMDGPRASRTRPSGGRSAGKLRSENAISHDRHQPQVQLGSCIPFLHYGEVLFCSSVHYLYHLSRPYMNPRLESSTGKRLSLAFPGLMNLKLPQVF